MGAAISDPSEEDLHRRGQRCSHSSQPPSALWPLVTSAGTAPAHAL